MKLNTTIAKFTTVSCITVLLSACGSDISNKKINSINISHSESSLFVANISVTNPSNFIRSQQPIYVSYYDLGLSDTDDNIAHLQVTYRQKAIASQAVDIDNNGENDGLFILSDMAAGQALAITINKSTTAHTHQEIKLTQAEISHKVGGQWVTHTKPPAHAKENQFQEYIGGHFENVTELTPPPQYTDHSNWIRYEGPGIESDKVGYRIYLDWRNGFDIFGKKTNAPILQNIGQDGYESYHHLENWGMDILKVGSSLGAGGFGLWQQKKLELVTDVEKWQAKITSNGNLYSSVQINYQGWQNSLHKQDLTANISMYGGSRLAKINLALTKDVNTIAAGVVKHNGTEFIQGSTNITNKAYTYIASWGKQSLDGSMLGMAVFFKKGDLAQITQDDKNYLAILKPVGQKNQQQVNYYFSAAWQPESGISTKDDFIHYLKQEAEKLTLQPRIQIKSALTLKEASKPLTADTALNWSKALADSELTRKTLSYHYSGWDVHRQRKPKFEYDIIGMIPMSYEKLAQLTGEDKYKGIVERNTGSYINEQGDIGRYKLNNFNIDNVAPGRNILTLFKQTGEDKYRIAAKTLRKQLAEQPKTSEGAFWHKKKYTGQLWLDGVYMGMPFLAEYAMMFETGEKQKHSLDEVVNEFLLTRKYLRDQKTGLYYHGWDELKQQDWADKSTGLSPEFWARGMGWLAMAIVDVLDTFPEENTEQRQQLIELSQEIAADIIKVQDNETGTWWQIMDKPNAIGNYKESSASAMFTYFLAKAINKGYISSEIYEPKSLKAYQGMIDNFVLLHANGEISMTQQCYVAGLGFGRDGSYHYYMQEPIYNNDPKGNVPFILAGIEISHLLEK
ncbi:glycoside hydrolase family 88 protein [Colwellia sp. MB02u-18]|uniref:glycoside hydrolase family 88 protein n=1 Tax=unclassified Colwellia TaxID=196834 RepID=UPI0015F3EBAD|nr:MULTISPECIES: glycoside hydrolase family 88 protein [unclassified Colwellia]MBA6222649.1 glycoside hydrolase family 88 protein [Colwellia sp. MB3u-45]MBA6269163.1 glycoside hydrolase family 88 protein [Colwellia sp. MB3u-43]MBA6322782.1 glycoside hydrolase family 88 protein [Colwellia sp. MB02u-19]MBA6323445.1 glycoside hydrolase family 88 protein [Colwellia sp. MB02u-18]MBA6332925.1 glycoside hydrolase family 88 protein [Colwellia sp. MB02u-12]